MSRDGSWLRRPGQVMGQGRRIANRRVRSAAGETAGRKAARLPRGPHRRAPNWSIRRSGKRGRNSMAETIDAVLVRAAQLTTDGRPRAAIELLRPVLVVHPDHSGAWCRLSVA